MPVVASPTVCRSVKRPEVWPGSRLIGTSSTVPSYQVARTLSAVPVSRSVAVPPTLISVPGWRSAHEDGDFEAGSIVRVGAAFPIVTLTSRGALSARPSLPVTRAV